MVLSKTAAMAAGVSSNADRRQKHNVGTTQTQHKTRHRLNSKIQISVYIDCSLGGWMGVEDGEAETSSFS